MDNTAGLSQTIVYDSAATVAVKPTAKRRAKRRMIDSVGEIELIFLAEVALELGGVLLMM